MPKLSNPLYAEKVKKLTKVEAERLLSRMTGKLPRRLEKDKLSRDEALALQMELEDEQLQEWRKMMAALNKKSEGKEKNKEAKKAKPVAKPEEKAKSPAKSKAVEKTKKTAKPKDEQGK
ncbi:MAG: hypothetical protein PXX77_06085 [Gallionella sp.]|nr:hypothetical protein [Gallionella sp.]